MNLQTIAFKNYEENLPQTGRHIVGQIRGDNIIVYQAFNPQISDFAVQNQKFGGAAYSFSRMSWIKPNFLWMMYRAGWASKPGQERILAIEFGLENFEKILEQAVYSSFQPDVYASKNEWENALENSEVRLQWDPDHDIFGQKLSRRAIQLGLKGKTLEEFATEWVKSIEDITPFVLEQASLIAEKDFDNLLLMDETEIPILKTPVFEKLKIGQE